MSLILEYVHHGDSVLFNLGIIYIAVQNSSNNNRLYSYQSRKIAIHFLMKIALPAWKRLSLKYQAPMAESYYSHKCILSKLVLFSMTSEPQHIRMISVLIMQKLELTLNADVLKLFLLTSIYKWSKKKIKYEIWILSHYCCGLKKLWRSS